MRKAFAIQCETRNDPCWLCGQPINYKADYPAEDSFTVDHMYPVATHPHLAEDPGNLRPCHALCNWARGTKKPQMRQSEPTRDW